MTFSKGDTVKEKTLLSCVILSSLGEEIVLVCTNTISVDSTYQRRENAIRKRTGNSLVVGVVSRVNMSTSYHKEKTTRKRERKMQCEEDERIIPADVLRSMYQGDDAEWWEKLRTAETEADFDNLKDGINATMDVTIFHVITSPEVLRACLRYMQLEKEPLRKTAYQVASRHRVDLLAVFFSEQLTWEEFVEDERDFSDYINSVLTQGHIDVMLFLLDKGLSVDQQVTYRYGYRTCLLAIACCHDKLDIIDLLLSRGVNVNMKITGGATPVFRAAEFCDVNVLDRLYLHGADLLHRNDEGKNLWSATSPFGSYSAKVPVMRWLAQMRVPLDRETYEEELAVYQCRRYQVLREILGIMREALISQGEEVEELPE